MNEGTLHHALRSMAHVDGVLEHRGDRYYGTERGAVELTKWAEREGIPVRFTLGLDECYEVHSTGVEQS